MKKILLGLFVIGTFASATILTKYDGRSIPAVDVKTINGKTINTSTFSNNGKPMVIDFWATWCKPCKKELDAISEVYADWQKETGVKLIAISIDDSRSSAKVATDAKTHGWEYEVYLDENQDFKRALNVGDIPQVFILNGKGEVVWQHNGYVDGGEEHIFEILKKVAKGEKITE
jgi:cytochrome c biogenesis protein CcmG, thiol:disulfide interchange protein DsbE